MNLPRLLKAIIVGLSGLFIVITLFSLLIPSTVRVSRVTVINDVVPSEVYNQVAKLENWISWHPIFNTDSATINFTDQSKKACDIIYHGSTTHLSIVSLEPTLITFELIAKKQNEIKVEIHLTNLPDQHAVQVEWRALNKLSWYPWEKFYGIFLDKLSGPGYEAALNGLKEFLESH